MAQTANNYAVTLYELSIPKEAIQASRELISAVPQLVKVLSNPLVQFSSKRSGDRSSVSERNDSIFQSGL